MNNQKNLFEDDQSTVSNVVECSDVKELIQNPDELRAVEERVKTWVKRVQEVCIFLSRHSSLLNVCICYVQCLM